MTGLFVEQPLALSRTAKNVSLHGQIYCPNSNFKCQLACSGPNHTHPVYFQKTSAAPFGNRSPQLRGAWVCTWADLQNLQGGAPHPIKQRRDELRKRNVFVSLPLWWRLLILVDSCAELGWPDTLGTHSCPSRLVQIPDCPRHSHQSNFNQS